MFDFDVVVHSTSEGDIHSIKVSLAKLIRQGASIMATLAEVKAALQLAAETAADEKAEVAAKFVELNAQIQALKDQIASGAVVTAADLDELVSAINGISASVEDITVPELPAP